MKRSQPTHKGHNFKSRVTGEYKYPERSKSNVIQGQKVELDYTNHEL